MQALPTRAQVLETLFDTWHPVSRTEIVKTDDALGRVLTPTAVIVFPSIWENSLPESSGRPLMCAKTASDWRRPSSPCFTGSSFPQFSPCSPSRKAMEVV